ncbi:thioredoxin family protein [bacterium]|nr:thioredoxin family protein [bacterium]
MQIKVLGAGCANCHTLEDRTNLALGQLGAEGTIEMVTDYSQIAGYGVMATPALVVDGIVVFSGRVPDVPELVSILAGTQA